MIKPIALLLAIIALESQAPGGLDYWPRYILEAGLVAGLIGMSGIVRPDGRPTLNYCKKCGRAYPGSFHRCEKI